ncbi:MAG: hybrid-cluster NAD(P)-dependent oxidoreductase [Aliivibrio sp.]|uniref:2Fe-2S iron-sulfur cluster-binding protein n=1 Tax=Aliivibrio sp. TaxID=1872443 RepID=UPI001A538335|nr:hybrid-cluster NAD(P)-dependent oxidoreductase [Aliivibrio sp.]
MTENKAWDPSTETLVCVAKWMETADTVSLRFEANVAKDTARTFNFKPGQFLTIGIDIEQQMEYRAYSISSLPNANCAELTVKRVEGGKVSNYLIDDLSVGDVVTSLKPEGVFNSVDCTHRNRVTLISAGCGITPVMSMAKQWLATNADVEINFVHIARNKESIIFAEQLTEFANMHLNFHANLLLKDAEGTDYQQGKLSQSLLKKMCPELNNSTVFLCGPVQFMQDVKGYIESSDFDMNHFYEESFSPTVSKQGTKIDSDTDDSVQISVPDFGFELTIDKGTLLIDALEKGGIPVIAACRSGVCGSCKCKVAVGTVQTTSQETLTPDEIAQGFVLACSSTINASVEIALS